jgi:hypothetical protein
MRTYNAVAIEGHTLPFRRAHSVPCDGRSHRCKDDYLKVGELGSHAKPYSNLEEEQVLKRWMLLRRERN